jgi:phosphoglycerate kinase
MFIKPASAYRLLTKLIQTQPLAGKRVFLRADLNVPISKGTIESDYRLAALQPTLDLLIQEQATIVIATHIGRPTRDDEATSTAQLIPWFTQRGYTISFAADPQKAYLLSIQKNHTIIMLENLRFFAGEKTQDPLFAQQLAALGDYYVGDAFATLHRADTSIAHVPYLFAPDHRCIGLLVEKELTQIDLFISNPKRPALLMIGGGKVADKIPLLMNILETVDSVLLCPALVFSFLYAQGRPTGSSLVDREISSLCLALLEKAHKKQIKILFPLDYYVSYNSFTSPVEAIPVAADLLEPSMVGITIGPATVHMYNTYLASAGSILINGLMGDINRPETVTSSYALFKTVAANTNAIRIIGGGDSVAAVEKQGLISTIGSISTGGGSLLALLGGQQLPGLKPFGLS